MVNQYCVVYNYGCLAFGVFRQSEEFSLIFNRGQMICMARFLWSHLIIGYLKIFKQPMVKSICTQVAQYPGKHSASVFLKHIFRHFSRLGCQIIIDMASSPQIMTFSGSKCSVGKENEGPFFGAEWEVCASYYRRDFAASAGQKLNVSISMNYVRPQHCWSALYSLYILRRCKNWTRCFHKIWVCGHFYCRHCAGHKN